MANTYVEQILFTDKQTWFYKVPPIIGNVRPRADLWNPDKPLMTGSCNIIQKGDECYIRLFEPLDSKDINKKLPCLFAQCPVHIDKDHNLDIYVQDCCDSSRYFVIRVQDEKSKRHAYIGIGFLERSTAFNFKAVLQDYFRYRIRQMEAERRTKENDKLQSNNNNTITSKYDFTLEEGKKIHIHLNNIENNSGIKTSIINASNEKENNFKLFALSPPPPPAPSVNDISNNNIIQDNSNNLLNANNSQEEWADFSSI